MLLLRALALIFLLVLVALITGRDFLGCRLFPSQYVQGVWEVVGHTNGGTGLPTGVFHILDFNPHTSCLDFSDGACAQPGPAFSAHGSELHVTSEEEARVFSIAFSDPDALTIADSSVGGSVQLRRIERGHLYSD